MNFYCNDYEDELDFDFGDKSSCIENNRFDYDYNDDFDTVYSYTFVESRIRYINSVTEDSIEYVIVLDFIDEKSSDLLLNIPDVSHQIERILIKKTSKKDSPLLKCTILSITQKQVILLCQTDTKDITEITKIINEIKSDITCLTQDKLFKKSYSIERNLFK